MVYSFRTPFNKAETCKAIKAAIAAIGGTTRDISPCVFSGKWRSKQYHTVFPKKHTFYVGDGTVRVVSGSQNMEFFIMRFPLRGWHTIWNRFIESLLSLYPNHDFGLVPGDIELVAVELLGDASEQVFVTKTEYAPSLAGAIIGGELFGTVGAIIGGSYGTSYTTTTATTKYADCVLARGRYSNGLLAQGRISETSHIYNEILVNMRSLSQDSPKASACNLVSSVDERKLSLEEKNAIKEARSYLSCEHLDYSRTGLIEQLEYEGYSIESATKAVDSLTVDWNAQAASAAKSYMSSEYQSFSRKGLIEQLEYDGYTPEQAEFGAKSVGY